MIAALAAISQRPEFSAEIAPRVEHTNKGMKLHFKMFYKGEPIVVTIDDKLPFVKPKFYERLFFGKRPSLVYARSVNDDSFYLASLFEKAVVKLVCNNNYIDSEGMLSDFVLSLFSDCMISCYVLRQTDLKQNLIDYLKREIDNKNSVVLCINPDLLFRLEDIDAGHAYVVMDYNLEHKAIKLYDPRKYPPYFYAFNTKLPLSITERADLKKGELWITLDQLEKRRLSINSLYPKNMHKSVFKVNSNLKQINYDRPLSGVKYACKVDIKQASTFTINIFSYSHRVEKFTLNVFTADKEKQNVEFNGEVPRPHLYNPNQKNGNAKSIYYQSFKLQPNQYIFKFEIEFQKINTKVFDLMMKIGSVSECSFKEIVEENKE